ncbi:MAG: hypothetical protein M3137_08915 [Actinomycetota bacterium]|nr:hypothetical protein [Actinomycetota bacterium]
MTSPGSPWWAGVPPVESNIDCGGHFHRVRWDRGVLAIPDDAGDDCLTAVRGWKAMADDARVLVLGRRHPGDTISRAAADGSDDPLARLLGLVDPALDRRLQLEVAHHMATRYVPGSSEAVVVEAATVGRLTRTLDRWLGPNHRSSVSITSSPEVTEDDGVAHISLTPVWLARVWARYLALVDGFLVLDVNRIVDDRAEVIGVGEPRGDPALLTVTGPAPWRVVSRQPLTAGGTSAGPSEDG